MLLVVFKYCLPALLGYILFVGISGSFAPLVRPADRADRPTWLLGLWTGSVLFLSLAITSHFAYQMPFEQVGSLLRPVAIATVLAIVLGALAARAYRRREEISPVASPSPAASSSMDELVDTGASGHIADSPTDIIPDESTDEMQPAATTAVVQTPELANIRRALADEQALREETEKHLRITRKALWVLEALNRDYEVGRADAMIALEEELESHVRKNAAMDSRLEHEREKIVSLENSTVDLKQRLLEAKSELRHSTQARAKALATAHKALARARRAVEERSRADGRMEELQSTLLNRQQTIASLIKTLEQEKNRTELVVEERARRLLMQQRQLHARRGVENAAKAGAARPGSRLVKRIAKARPIEGSAG